MYDDETKAFEKAAAGLTGEERETVRAALDAAMDLPRSKRDAILHMVAVMGTEVGRHRAKARRDLISDKSRRILIGARVPRPRADAYAAAAAAAGKSMYRWVVDTLDAAERSQ